MFASYFITFLAFVVSLVAAQTGISGTTTSTVELTQTITITRCNPTVTNCPANKHNTTTTTSTSLSSYYPLSNTSSIVYPTSYSNSSSRVSVLPISTSAPVVVLATTVATKAGAAATTTPAAAAAATVSTSGAQALFIQSGLVLSGLAAAVALLA